MISNNEFLGKDFPILTHKELITEKNIYYDPNISRIELFGQKQKEYIAGINKHLYDDGGKVS